MALTEVPAQTAGAGAGILAIMKFVQLLALLFVAGGIFGCGQKGPLVMPDAQKHKRTVPTLPGAPAKPANGSTAPTASPAPPADPAHP